MKIHPALSKSEIALRYYKKMKPDRTYTKEGARKQFDQDQNLDGKTVRAVMADIYKEALRLSHKE